VAEYLVELYVARSDKDGAERCGDRARLAAEQLASEGVSVRYVRSIFVPEDETCFYLYEAASPDVVREAARRAGFTTERVTRAVSDTQGGTT
jgi:Nickel responsive protein SCO4226-like